MSAALLVVLAALGGMRDRSQPAVDAAAAPAPAWLRSCAGAATIYIGVSRPSIPERTVESWSCGVPGFLPLWLEALVLDAEGYPVAGCDAIFYVDLDALSGCGRTFGEFCPTGVIGTTDAGGVARVPYTLTQTDLDFLNCLPGGCACVPPTATCAGGQPGWGFCPAPATCVTGGSCRQTPFPEDLFGQFPFRAAAGGALSTNVQYVEYGR